MRRLNQWIANHLANALASMILFWLLNVVVFTTLAFQRPHGAQHWILFFVSIWFQGVSLPVLGFVGKLQGDRSERLLRETHDAVMAELADLKQLHADLRQGGRL